MSILSNLLLLNLGISVGCAAALEEADSDKRADTDWSEVHGDPSADIDTPQLIREDLAMGLSYPNGDFIRIGLDAVRVQVTSEHGTESASFALEAQEQVAATSGEPDEVFSRGETEVRDDAIDVHIALIDPDFSQLSSSAKQRFLAMMEQMQQTDTAAIAAVQVATNGDGEDALATAEANRDAVSRMQESQAGQASFSSLVSRCWDEALDSATDYLMATTLAALVMASMASLLMSAALLYAHQFAAGATLLLGGTSIGRAVMRVWDELGERGDDDAQVRLNTAVIKAGVATVVATMIGIIGGIIGGTLTLGAVAYTVAAWLAVHAAAVVIGGSVGFYRCATRE